MTNRETITRISVFAEDYCRAPPTDAATDPYSKRIGTGTVAMQLCIQKSVFGWDVSLSLSLGGTRAIARKGRELPAWTPARISAR